MFYEHYHKELWRRFTHGAKELYVNIIDYIIQNTRKIWASDLNVPFWHVRTNIQVNSKSLK